eukprot:SAG31_NODE_2860_length_4990_cov_2.244326_3_plen_94_part_00
MRTGQSEVEREGKTIFLAAQSLTVVVETAGNVRFWLDTLANEKPYLRLVETAQLLRPPLLGAQRCLDVLVSPEVEQMPVELLPHTRINSKSIN